MQRLYEILYERIDYVLIITRQFHRVISQLDEFLGLLGGKWERNLLITSTTSKEGTPKAEEQNIKVLVSYLACPVPFSFAAVSSFPPSPRN